MSFEAKKPRRKDPEMTKAIKDVATEASTRLNVEIPESSMKLLKKIVVEKETTIKDYINELLKNELTKEAKDLGLKP